MRDTKPDPYVFHRNRANFKELTSLSCFTRGREVGEGEMFDISFHLHDFLFILYDFVIYKVKCLKCERKIVV